MDGRNSEEIVCLDFLEQVTVSLVSRGARKMLHNKGQVVCRESDRSRRQGGWAWFGRRGRDIGLALVQVVLRRGRVGIVVWRHRGKGGVLGLVEEGGAS